ncbi:MAG: DUF4214 domain-containing protein, partial [Pseudooceanicola sp.]
MDITFFGRTDDLYGDTFGSTTFLSWSSTEIVFKDNTSGFVGTLTGAGFSDPNVQMTGTVTGLQVQTGTLQTVMTATNFAWSAADFDQAVRDAVQFDDMSGMDALFSLQNVNFDASAAVSGLELFFRDVTSDVTFTGSGFRDRMMGGEGNDTLNSLGSDDGDQIWGSEGSDRIIYSDDGPGTSWNDLAYTRVSAGIIANLNGLTNTATVQKTTGADVIVDIANVLNSGEGFGFHGSNHDDTLTINGGAGSWMWVAGGRGADTFNLTLTGGIRLEFQGGYSGDATSGAVVNLASGTVSNDGFGFTDTINVTDGAGYLELRATNRDDLIVGSARNDVFVLMGGTDTLDAAEGTDLVRYNRSGVEAINVDLLSQSAFGTWDGVAFNHTLVNVENVFGTWDGNDTILGDTLDNYFEGHGGNDVLSGHDGADTLEGHNGNDTLNGGNGADRLRGGSGNDVIMGGNGSDNLGGWEGDDYIDPGGTDLYDYVDPHSGNDTVAAGSVVDGFLVVSHWSLAKEGVGQVIQVNETGTATVDKGGSYGMTYVLNADSAMTAMGLEMTGSDSDDTFNVDVSENGFILLLGGAGNDVFNLGATTTGWIQLDYRDGIQEDAPLQGVSVNLATGVVANDGFGGIDTINGAENANIQIRGSVLADTLVGGAGEDSFALRDGGNDSVDGGGGRDWIRYDFDSLLDMGVDVDLAAGTVTGSHNGMAFTQTVTGIEGVYGTDDFGDVLYGAEGENWLISLGGDDVLLGDGLDVGSTPVAGQVYRLFRATLDREPGTPGLLGWTAQVIEGTSTLEEVTSGFVNSLEFQTTYGSTTNTEFVTLLYQNVLDREPDSGLNAWVNALDTNTLTREQVTLSFSESTEFQNTSAVAARAFIEARSESVWADDVYRLYQAT